MTSQPTALTTRIHQIQQGDVISLPKPPEQYSDNPADAYQTGEYLRITKAWFHSGLSRHMIQLDNDHSNAIVAFADPSTEVTLHERPGFGPLDADYQIGQKVYAHWMNETLTGIVEHIIQVPDESVYTVRTSRGTRAYVGPENMRADHSPLPAEDQQWVCLLGRHKGTILTVVEADGLEGLCRNETTGTVSRYILASVDYGLTIATAPEPAGVLGVDYEDVEMDVLGSSRMVRIFR